MKANINIGMMTIEYEADSITREITITGYSGNDSRLRIPDEIIEGYSITSVGKKALMGARSLKEISLPSSIKCFEDWAFASCVHLESLIIRANEEKTSIRPEFGKGVFEGCTELESILLGYEKIDDFAILLGAAIWRLPASYLFKDPDIGTDRWFASWDRSLCNYLNQRDDEGYTDRVLCGEEDISYDGIGSVDGELLSDGTNYIIETRQRKCHLCFLRLKADANLSDENRVIFEEYLRNHSKGMKSQEAWLVLREELRGKMEYVKLFANIGGIQLDYIDDMLLDLGEDYAEVKAFLIQYKQNNNDSDNDIFNGLLL